MSTDRLPTLQQQIEQIAKVNPKLALALLRPTNVTAVRVTFPDADPGDESLEAGLMCSYDHPVTFTMRRPSE